MKVRYKTELGFLIN